jgi:hypothetical protein
MTDRELLQQALDALGNSLGLHIHNDEDIEPVIEAIKTRLAQPEKEWVGLTKEEARKICVATVPYVVDMAAAIEAKLKEKNT